MFKHKNKNKHDDDDVDERFLTNKMFIQNILVILFHWKMFIFCCFCFVINWVQTYKRLSLCKTITLFLHTHSDTYKSPTTPTCVCVAHFVSMRTHTQQLYILFADFILVHKRIALLKWVKIVNNSSIHSNMCVEFF